MPEPVVRTAAVTEPGPQVSVRPEGQLAAVVVARRLVERQQHAPALGLRNLAFHRHHRDPAVGGGVGVAEIQLGAVGAEDHAQQPVLASLADLGADIGHELRSDVRVSLAGGGRVQQPHLPRERGDIPLAGPRPGDERNRRLDVCNRHQLESHVGKRRHSIGDWRGTRLGRRRRSRRRVCVARTACAVRAARAARVFDVACCVC